jgi:hypothetical protein
MKGAADKISRSEFEIYTYSTRHDLSDQEATDELLQMLTYVSHTAISCCACAYLCLKVDP